MDEEDVKWGVPGGCGLIAHALGKRRASDTKDRPLCGVKPYSWYGPQGRAHVRCIRCLRIIGKKPSKTIRERIEVLHLELRALRARERRESR